jgi:hypothetical protein
MAHDTFLKNAGSYWYMLKETGGDRQPDPGAHQLQLPGGGPLERGADRAAGGKAPICGAEPGAAQPLPDPHRADQRRAPAGSGPAGGDARPVPALVAGTAGQAPYLLHIRLHFRADGGRAEVGAGGGYRSVPAGVTEREGAKLH